MGNLNKDNHDKPTLEELLRFKRTERPDDAFWDKFDGELHQRMMRALVKKDPWPTQLLRGLSGKVAQTSAIAGVAAVLAFMVIQPAFVPAERQSQPAFAEKENHVQKSTDTMSDEIETGMVAEADYEIEKLTAATGDENAVVTQDYGLDHIEVATYDTDVYSADMAFSGFTSGSVASLVY